MADITKNQRRDQAKYYLNIPEYGFSPTRNKMIVENSIKKYEAMRRKQKEKLRDPYAERADAVVSYLRFADRKPGYELEKYFSKSYLAYLRGVDILREMYARMQIYNNEGELIKLKF